MNVRRHLKIYVRRLYYTIENGSSRKAEKAGMSATEGRLFTNGSVYSLALEYIHVLSAYLMEWGREGDGRNFSRFDFSLQSLQIFCHTKMDLDSAVANVKVR